MRDHWYCGNIPPRPLDDKRKDFEFGGKKKKTRQSLDQSKSRFGKSGSFFQKERDKTKSVKAGVSQSKERGEKDRCKVDERGEGETVSRCGVGL